VASSGNTLDSREIWCGWTKRLWDDERSWWVFKYN